MFEALTRWFQTPEPKPLDPDHVPTVIAALLVHMAKSDTRYLFEEIAEIDHILAHHYDIGPVDAAKLRADGERLEKALPDTKAFAEKLRAAVDTEERMRVVDAMRHVMLADGIRREEEAQMLLETQEILGLVPGNA